jgi:hypothetical protein
MTAPKALEALSWAQGTLEDFYGAKTGLDVRDFVRTLPDFPELGRLHVEQDLHRGDLDLALLLDRDLFSAWESSRHHRAVGVICEEVSHFVYLGFNHRRRRNVSALELELQSEIDRILLAFHPAAPANLVSHRSALLDELCETPYDLAAKATYEDARKWAAALVRSLSGGDPCAWGDRERRLLCDFFHKDLSEKLHMLRSLK